MAVLVALRRVLGGHALQDAGELGIDGAVEVAHVRDLGPHHLQQQAQRALVVEGHAPGEQFEQHDAQREDVRALVDRLAGAHLGREVARRADEFAGGGQFLGEIGGRERDAEIGDLDPAALVEHQVGGLDVAMDHAAVVRGGEAGGGLVDRPRRLLRRHLVLALEPGRERLALDELHGEIGLPLPLADVVDLDDVRVVERGHGAGLAQEALLDALVVRERRGQHLDRDVAAERRLVALVDHAHAAAAQLGDDVVVTDLRRHGLPPPRIAGANAPHAMRRQSNIAS